jgi:hypothetical protein
MEKGRDLLIQDASTLLYEQQAPAILAYFYRQTASWDNAEDLLVEVFLAALEDKRFNEISESEHMMLKLGKNTGDPDTRDWFNGRTSGSMAFPVRT